MLIFGHVGITLSAAILISGITKSIQFRGVRSDAKVAKTDKGAQGSAMLMKNIDSWVSYLGTRMDIRILLIGSILPDLIDKPVGQLFFRATFNNGRLFCHTFLFLMVTTIAGLILYKLRQRTGVLALALGIFAHLTLDQMWHIPKTLWWPLFGFAFPKSEISNWLANIFLALINDPSVYLPEILGLTVLIWFGWALFHRKMLYSFIRRGQI